MPDLIHHLVWRSDWRDRTSGGEYSPESLGAEGFVHCTREREIVPEIADAFFPPRPSDDLLLLTLDASRIAAPVRYEPVGDRIFPHVYGALPTQAAIRIEVMQRTGDAWTLPAGEYLMDATPESRLASLGVTLPEPPAPVAAYVGWVRTGNLVVTAGQLPTAGGVMQCTGKLGGGVDEAAGAEAAKLCCINAIAQLKAAVGTLSKVKQIVRLEGFVASAEGFHAQPKVLNGASEFLLAVFGDRGRHARMAVGVAELPLNAAVELCLWAEVE